MPSARNMYLVAYNVACAAGWGYILLECIRHIVAGSDPQELYNDVEKVMQIVQSAAIMEVIHAWLGVVRSPWLTTLMQVGSRIVVVWGFMWASPLGQTQIGVFLCITSWAAVEVPRYLFYAFGVMGSSPFTLFFLRYSLFAILYPTGVTGEVLTMFAGLPFFKSTEEPLSLGLGPLRISAYMVAIAVIAVYVPGAPFMYYNMVGNRRSAFKKRSIEAARKAA